MVADIVRRARTSRTRFYEFFTDREDCLVALLSETNADNIDTITAAVDPAAPWHTQVRQAVEAWFGCAESRRPLTLSWIRDVPALGNAARALQRSATDQFIDLVQTLSNTPELRAAGIPPVPRARAILLIGGLRELTAYTVENGEPLKHIVEEAVRSAIALIDPGSSSSA
jgi:AcrR family transcriptional regulator